MGRPSLYTPELAERICQWLADGNSLRSIDGQDWAPERTTIRRWCRDNEDFRSQYVRAREEAAEGDADEVMDIKRKVETGELSPDQGRVAMQACQWSAGKRHPKKYGERLQIDADVTMAMSDERVQSRLAQLLGKAGAVAAPRGAGAPEETA